VEIVVSVSAAEQQVCCAEFNSLLPPRCEKRGGIAEKTDSNMPITKLSFQMVFLSPTVS
jgi:hypothetical protein